MTKKKSISRILLGIAILVALLPLAFKFSQKGVELLLDTPFKYIVWGGEAILFLFLLVTKQTLRKNELISLSVLFILIPFTYTFNENGAIFFISTKYVSSIFSWAIASIVLVKLFFTNKLKEDSKI